MLRCACYCIARIDSAFSQVDGSKIQGYCPKQAARYEPRQPEDAQASARPCKSLCHLRGPRGFGC